jgi:hypothetical protein
LLNAAAMRAPGACASILLFTVVACAAEPDGPPADSVDDSADPTAVDPVETSVALAGSTIKVLRGVDRAGVFSTHEARVLKVHHGVRWSGVYIGGACNGGFGWSKSKVQAIANATGWRFMPIWVGQQSPAICGAHQLTYARGRADGVATAARMRAFGWGPHKSIPVALDVEAGAYFYSPNGSTAYVRGWVNAVHAAGYRAYVYGSPFGLVHFHDQKVRIDGAWAASYFYNGFVAVAPNHLNQMGGRYKHHNRAWQYAGNFSVSGAGRVDGNSSDFLLAPAPGGTNIGHIGARLVPAACGVLEAGEGLARGETLASCDGQTVLALSNDGALTLAANGSRVWSAETDGAGMQVVVDDNGELVVVDAEGETVFTSDTSGFPDARVELRAGAMHVTSDDGATLWTHTAGLVVDDAAMDVLDEDSQLAQ